MKKELGTITSAEIYHEDHGILTSSIYLDFGSSCQSFGGLALKENKIAEDYTNSLCKIFNVSSIKDLIGKKCYALRNSDSWGELIVGLETLDGKRFTHYSWAKKLFPEHTKHPLDSKKESILIRINSLKRQLLEAENELASLEAKFVNWE